MTAVEFSPQERARLDAIEAAQPAPESLRERVAEAILDSWYPDRNSPARAFMTPDAWAQFEAAADAALSVLRGEQ